VRERVRWPIIRWRTQASLLDVVVFVGDANDAKKGICAPQNKKKEKEKKLTYPFSISYWKITWFNECHNSFSKKKVSMFQLKPNKNEENAKQCPIKRIIYIFLFFLSFWHANDVCHDEERRRKRKKKEIKYIFFCVCVCTHIKPRQDYFEYKFHAYMSMIDRK
jgi:hypothetical protein